MQLQSVIENYIIFRKGRHSLSDKFLCSAGHGGQIQYSVIGKVGNKLANRLGQRGAALIHLGTKACVPGATNNLLFFDLCSEKDAASIPLLPALGFSQESLRKESLGALILLLR